jgi:ferritin-like metal-binding protein YciE
LRHCRVLIAGIASKPPTVEDMMRKHTLEDQLTKYLTDVHSIEVQALAQMKVAPRLAGGGTLAAVFRAHREETRAHERLVREQLEQRGADASTLKDLAGRVGGWAMIAFARLNPDTPGKLTAHAFAYEHMELAAYELLGRTALRAEDHAIAALAKAIGAQERTMGERLAECFDEAVDASLDQHGPDMGSALVSYLTDARAIEAQAVQLLESGSRIAGVPALADVLRGHLDETRGHQRLLDARLHAHAARPSRFQNTALGIGGANLGLFFAAQPDTPVKLAGFAYAFEHLEIAAYELLRRVADRASDPETVAMAEQILVEERRAAERVTATWDAAVASVVGNLVSEGAR